MERYFPPASEIAAIADHVILDWHRHEHSIFSLDDGLRLLSADADDALRRTIEQLAIINTVQWHEEDKSRDPDATDAVLARTKRTIDKLNARRVQTTEDVDQRLLASIALDPGAPLNTETPGSVVDRLIILSLKRYHMRLETERADADEAHRAACREKFAGIERQRSDLMDAYDLLRTDIAAGRRRFAMYRQFKMYNDPALNPVLYAKKERA